MTENRWPDYLDHMIEAAQLIGLYIEGMNEEDFIADKRTQQAVILNLIVIGEASSKMLSAEINFIEQNPEIPWKNMKGMRNRIAHGYFDIDLEIVWQTVQTAIPQLLQQLTALRSVAQSY